MFNINSFLRLQNKLTKCPSVPDLLTSTDQVPVIMREVETQDNDMDDVAWLNLFIQLTGGFSDVVTENRSRTDLTPETVDHLTPSVSPRVTLKRKSVDEKPREQVRQAKAGKPLVAKYLDISNNYVCVQIKNYYKLYKKYLSCF